MLDNKLGITSDIELTKEKLKSLERIVTMYLLYQNLKNIVLYKIKYLNLILINL